MPGQGEPTPTAPEVPAGRHAAEPIRSGIPADAGETGNGYREPARKTQRTVTTPLQRPVRRNPTTRILPAPEGKTDLGRDESGDLDPAPGPRDVSGQFGARMRRSETYYPNLAAFVERFVANVFCYHQSASVNMQWVSDWWRYPALVFPLDAMWRGLRERAQGTRPDDDLLHPGGVDARPRFRPRTVASSPASTASRISPGRANRCPANARTGHGANRSWKRCRSPAAGGKENKETTITPTRRRNNGSN